MNPRAFLLALALLLCARAGNGAAVLSNLNTPGPQGGGIGDLETLVPGSGFGVGFVTGDTSLILSSATLELYGYSPAGFHVRIYTFGRRAASHRPVGRWCLTGCWIRLQRIPGPRSGPGKLPFSI